jgi:hypothetical protein
MRFRSIAVALVSLTAASTAQGQGATAHPSCAGVTADACQQAVDLFMYMAPQLGTAIAGGNTTLAQGGSLGGMTFGLVPKFAVGLRLNAVMGNIPVLQQPTLTGPGATSPPAARNFTTETSFVGLPAVDLAVGVFKGVPLGLTNVGGVDLLLSAAYVPKLELDNITVDPDKSLEFGYGVRVGLLQEGLLVPGVGFSYIIRKLPTTTITGTAGTGGAATSVAIEDLSLKANSWRLTVSKSLLLFGLAAGVGQDKSSTETALRITPPSPAAPAGPFTLKQDVTRLNYFADVSMNLLLVKLVGTIGMVSGGDIVTYNRFDNAPDKSRMYGSVGIRVGL